MKEMELIHLGGERKIVPILGLVIASGKKYQRLSIAWPCLAGLYQYDVIKHQLIKAPMWSAVDKEAIYAYWHLLRYGEKRKPR